MHPTLRLTINSSDIRLELPPPRQMFRYANRVAYNPDRLTLLSFGKSEAELKQEMGRQWLEFRNGTSFTRIFDPAARGPIFDYKVIESILLQAREALFPHRLERSLPLPWNAIEIEAHIQDYEQLSLGRRLELEYYLQDFQNVRRLVINEQDCSLSPAWRNTQALVGLLFRVLSPVAMLYAGLLALTRQWNQGTQASLLLLAGSLAGALIAYILGTILWLLLFRNHLPYSYLRFQLRFSRSWLRPINQWLTEKLLVSK